AYFSTIGVLEDLESLEQDLRDSEGDAAAHEKFRQHAEASLIKMKELNDVKLQYLEDAIDLIEDKICLLKTDQKSLDMGKDGEKGDSLKDVMGDRGNKRSRRSARTDFNHGETGSESGVVEKSPAPHPKRAARRRKRKQKIEKEPAEESPGDIPIDPDEPTYCLCEQVSFGDMIGCDNDLCPIEWFHFSCVNLSCKPKGKWYCPRCRGDKPTVMKPKAQFLKELEKYNKEKEERNGKEKS
ncbi:unnamed protein product, partial [Darwinula stevensoni]